jgi:hypothetical protein
VFEHRVLRRIFGLRRDEVTGCWSISRIIKSRRMRLARYVAQVEEKNNSYFYLIGGKARGKDTTWKTRM